MDREDKDCMITFNRDLDFHIDFLLAQKVRFTGHDALRLFLPPSPYDSVRSGQISCLSARSSSASHAARGFSEHRPVLAAAPCLEKGQRGCLLVEQHVSCLGAS